MTHHALVLLGVVFLRQSPSSLHLHSFNTLLWHLSTLVLETVLKRDFGGDGLPDVPSWSIRVDANDASLIRARIHVLRSHIVHQSTVFTQHTQNVGSRRLRAPFFELISIANAGNPSTTRMDFVQSPVGLAIRRDRGSHYKCGRTTGSARARHRHLSVAASDCSLRIGVAKCWFLFSHVFGSSHNLM